MAKRDVISGENREKWRKYVYTNYFLIYELSEIIGFRRRDARTCVFVQRIICYRKFNVCFIFGFIFLL